MVCSLQPLIANSSIFSNCSNITQDRVQVIALVRGVVSLFCFLLCLVTFVAELVYLFHSKKKSTTLQRLFVWLTFTSLAYTAVLSFHIEHYFTYNSTAQWQCYMCKIIGFFDQYTGLIQLLLTLGIALKLFQKMFLVSPRWQKKTFLSRHHLKLEACFVAACFCLPLAVIWVPLMKPNGLGSYGVEGAWCWIEALKKGCKVDKKGFLEQLLLWYVPYTVTSFISFLCVLAINIFLAYICLRHRNKSQTKVRVVMIDMCLLLPFLVAFCCICLVEVLIVVLAQIDGFHYDNFTMWICYAIVTPFSGVIIPIAFLIHLWRQRPPLVPRSKLESISQARHASVKASDRVSANSYTSQQDRAGLLSPSDVCWETSSGSAVIIDQGLVESQRTKYGSID